MFPAVVWLAFLFVWLLHAFWLSHFFRWVDICCIACRNACCEKEAICCCCKRSSPGVGEMHDKHYADGLVYGWSEGQFHGSSGMQRAFWWVWSVFFSCECECVVCVVWLFVGELWVLCAFFEFSWVVHAWLRVCVKRGRLLLVSYWKTWLFLFCYTLLVANLHVLVWAFCGRCVRASSACGLYMGACMQGRVRV